MPYKSIEELPSSIRKLPILAQKLFMKTFNIAYEKYGDKRAFKIAWTVVKKKFKKVKNKWIAKTKDFVPYIKTQFVFNPKEVVIGKSFDDYVYMEYILTDNKFDYDNQKWADYLLKMFSDQINKNHLKGYLANDKHLLLEFAEKYNLSPEEVEQIAKSLDTGIEAVSSKYIDGKLISMIKIPKPLVNYVKDKKISIEAIVPTDQIVGNELKGGKLISFIFTDNPANDRTGLVM